VARTRFIDDAISVALRGGISQMVILGAGFDARAYRLPGLSEVAVFEVDHPDTLARKRAAIIAQAPAAAAHVRFIATDFNTQTLAQAMSSSDFDARLPALILWEGVTNYLSPGAVDATLRWCARAASGSRVIFTYIHQAVLDAPQQFAGTSEIFAALQEAGEKWTFGLLPEQVPSYLQERGLTLEEDIGAADYRARYYGEAARDMHGYEFYRIAVAHVTAAA
jgi:methyltransferase (TIGR00027 family)